MADGVRRAWQLLNSDAIASLTSAVIRPDEGTVTDDAALEAYVRANVSHLVHPVGTAKMGPESDPLAVCDQCGRVRGLRQLRVADASLMPDLPRGNTNLTAIMIGERVAEFMRG